MLKVEVLQKGATTVATKSSIYKYEMSCLIGWGGFKKMPNALTHGRVEERGWSKLKRNLSSLPSKCGCRNINISIILIEMIWNHSCHKSILPFNIVKEERKWSQISLDSILCSTAPDVLNIENWFFLDVNFPDIHINIRPDFFVWIFQLN